MLKETEIERYRKREILKLTETDRFGKTEKESYFYRETEKERYLYRYKKKERYLYVETEKDIYLC